MHVYNCHCCLPDIWCEINCIYPRLTPFVCEYNNRLLLYPLIWTGASLQLYDSLLLYPLIWTGASLQPQCPLPATSNKEVNTLTHTSLTVLGTRHFVCVTATQGDFCVARLPAILSLHGSKYTSPVAISTCIRMKGGKIEH